MRKLGLLLLGSMIGSLSAANSYYVHNLVSDQEGKADHVDPNLVNPWGVAFSPASPFWIGNNGTGTSTLYNGTGGAISLVVNIPSPGGTAPGKVTGVIFNPNQSAFQIAGGPAATFLFCSEDGTITGWNPNVDRLNAKTMLDNSGAGASYKGCTLGGTADAPLLYAADYANNKISVYDGALKPVVSGFVNSDIPAGLAPYNIQNLNGTLYVSYAPAGADATTPANPSPYVAKPVGHATASTGFIVAYTSIGAPLKNFNDPSLNFPWGMTIAPANFGDFANMLLIGNFGDGMIHAFDLTSGTMTATLNDTTGHPIVIDGLWTLTFGNGKVGDNATLYFTAGPDEETHGLFGSIQGPPSLNAGGVENAASSDDTIAPNSFVAIFGGALAATSRQWATADFKNGALPTVVDGVSATINGEAAFIDFINPLQVNILVPTDIQPGPVEIKLTNNGLTSAAINATMLSVAPAFFTFGPPNADGKHYIAAQHADSSPGGPPNYVQGVTSTPFHEGEVIVLYGNGFGPTDPPTPNGQLITTALPLATQPAVTIGGLPAEVQFAGLSATGLYQFNVVVPTGLTKGTTDNIDVPVVIDLGGGHRTQDGAVISVVNPQ